MKNRKIFITLFILLSGLVFAQENTDKVTFKKVCESLSSKEITRGNFELERYIDKSKRALKSSGSFTISAKDGIIWFTEKPVETVMAVTEKYMIQVQPNGKKITTDASNNKTFGQIANITSSVFTGNYEVLENNFDIVFSKQEKTIWKAVLTPKDDSLKAFIENVTLLLDVTLPNENAGVFNVKITVFEMATPSKDKTTYKLSSQSYSDTLSENEKTFFTTK